jgi:IMP dehydrogenase
VIVGNIATPEAALFLVENGADGGRNWTWFNLYYIVAGVGFPQFSAVLEVAALKGTGVPVIADGEFATQEIFLKQLLPVLTV